MKVEEMEEMAGMEDMIEMVDMTKMEVMIGMKVMIGMEDDIRKQGRYFMKMSIVSITRCIGISVVWRRQ